MAVLCLQVAVQELKDTMLSSTARQLLERRLLIESFAQGMQLFPYNRAIKKTRAHLKGIMKRYSKVQVNPEKCRF